MLTHVELIKPSEKIDRSLGGTGYLRPSTRATVAELAEAIKRGQIIWKVARATVDWRRPAATRLLNLGEVQIKCVVIGGTGAWYFVRVLE